MNPRTRSAPLAGILLLLCALAAPLRAPAEPTAAATDAAPSATAPGPETKAVTGHLVKVSRTRVVLQKGLARNQMNPKLVDVSGSLGVEVSGHKKAWAELRKGDMVNLVYTVGGEGGPERSAVKVVVLPPDVDPAYAAALGKPTPRAKKNVRRFTGWIKLIEEDRMVVRTPDPKKGQAGEARVFVRTDETVVDARRDAWEDLRKGDRVTVAFGKGRPRPAMRVSVVLLGGKRPLPPGLATRLFDPKYDRTVKDVDGIGEVPPGTPWPPPEAAAEDS